MPVHGNYALFCSQLEKVTQNYPQLKISTDRNGLMILKGILDIPNDDKKIIGSFLIEIHFSLLFPYRFPVLYETGKSIEATADWHKFSDDSCCITVTPDEKLQCVHGISVLWFIRQHAIPYFANFIHRKVTGKYKNGEYAHSKDEALRQFYSELLMTSDELRWVHYFNMAFSTVPVAYHRNEKCLCGSGKKYKVCHQRVFRTLKVLGPVQVASDFRTMGIDPGF